MAVFKKIKKHIWRTMFGNARLSYSQSGEDLVLDTIFGSRNKGIYIDVGANNPSLQSNTRYFYNKGWSGMNIDALPGSMTAFRRARPRDINLELGVGSGSEEASYFMFENSLYNTFDASNLERIKQYSPHTGTRKIKTRKLSEILLEHKVTSIDFLTIDVEGKEMDVLFSNDWKLFRPKVVVMEHFHRGHADLESSELFEYMRSIDYIFFCNTVTNAFYLDRTFLTERFPEQW